MMRIVSVWLPQWPIERLRRERQGNPFWQAPDKTPFVLVETGEHGLTLSAANTPALAQGLVPGLGFADARARCPHLRSAAADATTDARALTALARWCGRYSPSLNVDGADGLWIDATGVAHLFGGETALLADMRARFAALGLTARIAVAGTLGAAWALARYGQDSPPLCGEGLGVGGISDRSDSPHPAALKRGHPPHQGEGGSPGRALSPLPVEALRLAPETALLLRRLGLKRIGQLYDLPRTSLARRFSSRDIAEAVLTRLDQALGRRSEPLEPLRPPSHYAARVAFPEPLISAEAFESALTKLAEMLCAQLARDLKGARTIAIAAYRADGTHAMLRAGLSMPCRAPAHMLRLLEEKTAALDLGFGVDIMTLAAPKVEPLSAEQAAFADRSEQPAPNLLIDRLSSRIGAARVLRPVARESHIPERAQAWIPALGGNGRCTSPQWGESGALAKGIGSMLCHKQTSVPPLPPGEREIRPTELSLFSQRPPLLLEQPEPIAVLAEIPEGPPARFTWRRVTRRVVRAQGPERIAPEWWREKTPNSPLTPPYLTPACGGDGVEGNINANGSPHPAALKRARPPHQGEGGEQAASLSLTSTSASSIHRTRDYYRIEDEAGGRYWVFRDGLYGGQDGAPGWYLHGVMG